MVFWYPSDHQMLVQGLAGVANETWEGKRTKTEMPKPFA